MFQNFKRVFPLSYYRLPLCILNNGLVQRSLTTWKCYSWLGFLPVTCRARIKHPYQAVGCCLSTFPNKSPIVQSWRERYQWCYQWWQPAGRRTRGGCRASSCFRSCSSDFLLSWMWLMSDSRRDGLYAALLPPCLSKPPSCAWGEI